MKKIKHIVKKITVTCAALALCFANVAMYSSAYSNKAEDSASNLMVAYTGYTVACLNCKGTFNCCKVHIPDFGTGGGYIEVDCHVNTRHFKKTFYGKSSSYHSIVNSATMYYGYWTIDLKNTKKFKTREGVDVAWKLA